jgi:endoglucanase
MKKYTSIWTQIGNYFKDYSNNLIFESLNEEGCWDSIWNRYSGASGDAKTRAYNILNNINQKFVDIIRASGGNNTSRCLLIAGYATDIDLTCDSSFKMPKDTINNKLIISVHYYTPSTFTILTADASWGKCATTWGTDAEKNQVKTDFNKMKNKFANNGVPVIIGEYGTVIENKDPASVGLYISTVCQTAFDMGFCPIFWDNGEHYSRSQLKFKDSQLASIFIRYKVSTTPTNTPITTSTEDINGDKAINMSDVMLIAEHFNTTASGSNYERKCDINNDGAVNMSDVMIVASKFNTTVAS